MLNLILSSRDSDVKRLESEISSFKLKAEKYDDISAHGIRSLIQMNSFNEKAGVREKERESRCKQAKRVLGMVRSSSTHNQIDGYNTYDDRNITHKRSRAVSQFMDRPSNNCEISQLSQTSRRSQVNRGRAMYRSSQDSEGILMTIRHREYSTMEPVNEDIEEPYYTRSTWQSIYSHQSYDEEEDTVRVVLLKP